MLNNTVKYGVQFWNLLRFFSSTYNRNVKTERWTKHTVKDEERSWNLSRALEIVLQIIWLYSISVCPINNPERTAFSLLNPTFQFIPWILEQNVCYANLKLTLTMLCTCSFTYPLLNLKPKDQIYENSKFRISVE